MTPFGTRLRHLRAERGVTLKRLAAELQVSSAYLSALEHGRRGAPSAGLVHQVNEFFGLIWDEADDLAHLARLSRPRVRCSGVRLVGTCTSTVIVLVTPATTSASRFISCGRTFTTG